MSIEMLNKILKDVSRWRPPLEEIVPVNYGEFFCREDWRIILSMISRTIPTTKIVIPTNGALLDEITVKDLCKVQSVSLVNFSINAHYEETYKKFMGLKADTLSQIGQAMKILRVERPDINLWASMVFDPQYQTDRERNDFFQFWGQYAAPQIIAAASAGRPSKPLDIVSQLPCRSIYSDIVIGYDGRLSSCCFDANFSIDCGEYTGNLKEDWNNKQLTELRRLHNEHKRNEIDLCVRCSFA